jgi:hypothetical protein
LLPSLYLLNLPQRPSMDGWMEGWIDGWSRVQYSLLRPSLDVWIHVFIHSIFKMKNSNRL